jgi:hypothetical protein
MELDKPYKTSRLPTQQTDAILHLRNVDKDLQNLFTYLSYNTVSMKSGNMASTGTGVVLNVTASAKNSAGWVVVNFVGGTTGFIPYWVGVTT